jgi:hypothetical protein
MNDNLKSDESQKKRCWGCAFFSTSPNWAPVGSGSSEYSCYLHGGSHIRKVGSGSCFCDCWEKKLIDTEGYDVESDKSYYEKREVHEAISELKKKFEMLLAEKDKEIAELKARIQLDDDEMAGFLQLEEECGGGDLRNYIAELKQKLEDAKASHYAEMVDAGMRERRLRRALYKACANWALSTLAWLDCIDQGEPRKWSEMIQKCRAKAEEYK